MSHKNWPDRISPLFQIADKRLITAIFLFLSLAELFPGPCELSLQGVEQLNRDGLSGVKQQNRNTWKRSQLFTKFKTKLCVNLIVGRVNLYMVPGCLNALQAFPDMSRCMRGCHFISQCIYSWIWHFKLPLFVCSVIKQANFLSYSIGLRLYHIPQTVRSEDYSLGVTSCFLKAWTWTWEFSHRFICMPLLWRQGKYSHRQPRCPRHYPCAVCLPTS